MPTRRTPPRSSAFLSAHAECVSACGLNPCNASSIGSRLPEWHLTNNQIEQSPTRLAVNRRDFGSTPLPCGAVSTLWTRRARRTNRNTELLGT